MEDNQFLGTFGLLANALSGGGNAGNVFPKADADDLMDGARYIPGEVTIARQKGLTVKFDRYNHRWQMPDGTFVE